MLQSRRPGSSSEIATGCESIQTVNRTTTTRETESLTRRVVKIEMNGKTIEKTTGDRAGAKSGLARMREILSLGP
jgi:hypothetical protein